MGEQRGEVFWSRHVAAAAGSGLSKAAYCRRHAINRKTFYRWVARVGGNPADPPPTQSLAPLSVTTSPMPGLEALSLHSRQQFEWLCAGVDWQRLSTVKPLAVIL